MQKFRNLKAKILSLTLSAAMASTMLPATASAAVNNIVSGQTGSAATIRSFSRLEDRFVPGTGEGASPNVYGLSVDLDTLEEDLMLPSELTALVERTTTVSKPAGDDSTTDDSVPDVTAPDKDEPNDDTSSGSQPASPSDANKEEIGDNKVPLAPEPEQSEDTVSTTSEKETVSVEWTCNKKYRSDVNDKFIYTAVLPDDYELADDVKLPQIYVFVGRQARAAETIDAGTVAALQNAFNNAQDGDTIILGKDIEVTGSQGIQQNKEITLTLDLNGYTISGSTTSYGLVATGQRMNASLIIKDSDGNGKIHITTGGGTDAAVCNVGYGTLTIENGNISSSSPDGAQAVSSRGSGDIVVNGGILEYTGTGEGSAILAMSGNLTINDGNIRSTQEGDGYAIDLWKELNLLGGTVTSKCTSKDNGTIKSYGSDANAKLIGGDVSNTATPEGYSVYLERGGKLTKTGGTVGRIGPSYTVTGTIKGDDTNSGIAATLQLKDSNGDNVGTAVTAAPDGTYTIAEVLDGNGYTIAVTCKGYISGTIPSFDVYLNNIRNKNLTLQKSTLVEYTGTQAAAPNSTPVTKTDTAITLAAVTVMGETVEYAYSTTNTAPDTGWQDSTSFTGLTAETTYYFFARVKENTIHTRGTASAGTAISTDMDDAKKIAAAKVTADATLSDLTATNATTADDILSAVNNAISSLSGVSATWKADSPAITKSTTSAAGSITGTIVLTCGIANAEVTVNKTIAKLSDVPTGGGSTGGGSSSPSGNEVWRSVPPTYQGGTKYIGNVIVPDYTVEGTWSKNADGAWGFTGKDGTRAANGWTAAFNPYANLSSGQSAFDWFMFDASGNMLTGWYTDIDGSIYYLNQSSDNTLGAMRTGWILIGGKYYYFNENPNGTRGKLLKNATTPDGYTVDENGVCAAKIEKN